MDVCNPKNKTIVDVKGCLEFKGWASFGHGSKVLVSKTGVMMLGDEFHVLGYSSFICKHSMNFGNNVLYGWECLTMDSDGHKIYDENAQQIKNVREITVGNNVWIGCRCSIFKGSVISSNSVIGVGTLITGQKTKQIVS